MAFEEQIEEDGNDGLTDRHKSNLMAALKESKTVKREDWFSHGKLYSSSVNMSVLKHIERDWSNAPKDKTTWATWRNELLKQLIE